MLSRWGRYQEIKEGSSRGKEGRSTHLQCVGWGPDAFHMVSTLILPETQRGLVIIAIYRFAEKMCHSPRHTSQK